MKLEGKTFWITGASSGIGEGVAVELASYGTTLILSGRNREALEKVGKTCSGKGAKVRVEAFDLTDYAAMEASVDKVLSEGVRVDGLLNFAGISQRSFAMETPLQVDRKVMEVDYFGTIAITKKLLPHIVENGGGLVLATSSIVGKFGFPYRSAYSAAKHALHGFFESLRAETAGKNLQVTIVIPGRVATNVSKNAITKTGEKYGKMDPGQEGGMDIGKSARIICRGISRGKKEILYGGISTLMVHIRRWFPCLYYKLASRVKPL